MFADVPQEVMELTLGDFSCAQRCGRHVISTVTFPDISHVRNGFRYCSHLTTRYHASASVADEGSDAVVTAQLYAGQNSALTPASLLTSTELAVGAAGPGVLSGVQVSCTLLLRQ